MSIGLWSYIAHGAGNDRRVARGIRHTPSSFLKINTPIPAREGPVNGGVRKLNSMRLCLSLNLSELPIFS
jgi:hypothetical protein